MLDDNLLAATMVLLIESEIARGGHHPNRRNDLEQALALWRHRTRLSSKLDDALRPFVERL